MTATWIIKKRNQQPDRREWSESVGWQTVRTWIVPADDRAALEQELIEDGAIKVSSVDDGATSTVSGTYPDARDGSQPGAEPQNVTWELVGNDLMKDIRTHSSLEPATDDDRRYIAEAKAAVDTGEEPASMTSWTTKAWNVYYLLSKGTTDYVLTQYVLRKTIRVSESDGVKASLTNVNKVEAPSGVPGALFSLPSEQGDGAIQWLKKPPTVTYLGRGKYAITQEWWAGKWSSVLYGGSATP